MIPTVWCDGSADVRKVAGNVRKVSSRATPTLRRDIKFAWNGAAQSCGSGRQGQGAGAPQASFARDPGQCPASTNPIGRGRTQYDRGHEKRSDVVPAPLAPSGTQSVDGAGTHHSAAATGGIVSMASSPRLHSS